MSAPMQRETWRHRTSDGVIHGSAVRCVDWERGSDGVWRMIRAYWECGQ